MIESSSTSDAYGLNGELCITTYGLHPHVLVPGSLTQILSC
ncbi:hypothetical protein BIFGAL_03768 [Bifidobacterium gallicum DSM 20093 = LMG 11596]|uniref:Uncharacterized protein n=1 Tax=Bifidobacterium gallicum DSM 20093 = LMG 11596 TaxID=561180 RepID=D1NV84_9BIFI|nr:hypothetical protein BIFGAL_03768 [Bifidobacterium gallicum DSM 20093 = LMG 11596]